MQPSRLLVVLLIFLAYALSYAPVYRVSHGAGLRFTVSGYQPIEWLIDHTPAATPLLYWAWLWEVDDEMVWDSAIRQIDFEMVERGSATPFHSASATP